MFVHSCSFSVHLYKRFTGLREETADPDAGAVLQEKNVLRNVGLRSETLIILAF